jgi:hypothetical protein
MGKSIIFEEVVPGSSSRLKTVDHKETYGRHILKKAVKNLSQEKIFYQYSPPLI